MDVAVFWLCALMAIVHTHLPCHAQCSPCSAPCPDLSQKDYIASGCAHDNTIGRTADHYVLDGRNSRNSWEHCIIWDNATATVNWDYIATANFYNLYGKTSSVTGAAAHIGFAFNMEDERNYDYIYIRVHQSNRCIQKGSLTSGQFSQNEEGDCVNRPLHKTWFTLSVEVSAGTGTLYIDGAIAYTFSPTFATRSKAAVFTWNGYNNVVFFRDFKVSLL